MRGSISATPRGTLRGPCRRPVGGIRKTADCVVPVRHYVHGVAHILVVDDDRAIRQVLAEFLRAQGHQVDEASGGAQALAFAETRPFDLIFLDILMPGIGGVETLRRLRQDVPQSRVVMVSGTPDERLALECVDLGAADYIRKPFDLEYLKNVVLMQVALAA